MAPCACGGEGGRRPRASTWCGTLPHQVDANNQVMPGGWVRAVGFSPSGQVAQAVCGDGTVYRRRLDRQAGAEEFRPTGEISAVAFAADGPRVLLGRRDGSLSLWDLDDRREGTRFEGHGAAVWGLAFSPDGRRIPSGSEDRTVRLWDARTGREVCRLVGHEDTVWGVAFSGDGRSALSGSDDKTMRLWHLPD